MPTRPPRSPPLPSTYGASPKPKKLRLRTDPGYEPKMASAPKKLTRLDPTPRSRKSQPPRPAFVPPAEAGGVTSEYTPGQKPPRKI